MRKSENYNLSWSQQYMIATASALHDIGKIGIDEKILNKPGKLTKEEFEIMVNDIKEITFVDDNNINIASTKNEYVINYAVSLLIDDNHMWDVYNMYRINTKVKGDTYKFTIYVTEDDDNYINNK